MHKDIWILGTWGRDGTLTVFTQYKNLEQNFKLGPSPIQVSGTGSGKISSSVALDPKHLTESSIRPESPMKALIKQVVASTEEHSMSTINHTKEAKAFL